VVDAQIQADSTAAAGAVPVQQRPAVRRPAASRARYGSRRSDSWQRLTTAHPWIARVVEAESPLWVTLLLAIPILAVFLNLTVGVKHDFAPAVDVDYWWHVATGNWVLDHHRVPTTDPFSWTYGGKEWIAHEWLAETILALSVRAGGYAGGVVLTTAIAVVGYWFLMAALRSYGMSRRAVVLLTILVGAVYLRSGVIVVRPQVFTWTLLAILFAELAAYDTGRRKQLWVIPVIFAFWINMNLTALIGIGCLGAYVLDHLIRRPVDRHVVTVGLLSGFALIVNPHHVKIFFLIFKYLNPDSVRRQYIFEWMPPRWHQHSHWPFALALLMLLPAAWVLIRRRPMLYPAAPLVVLAYQGLQSIRYIPIYIMLALVFAAWLLWKQSLSRGVTPPLSTQPLIPRRPWVLAPPIAAAALAVFLATNTDSTQLRHDPLTGYHPVAVADYYLEHFPGERMFNTYDFGGYFVYRFAGTDNKVYIDGREEMYGEERVKRYFYYIYGREGWEKYFDEQGINVVIVRGIDGLFPKLSESPEWKRVYYDRARNQHVFIRETMPTPAGS